MAVVATNLTSGNFTGSFTTQDTASVTPTSNALVLLTVSVRNGASTNPTLTSVTGNGLTWVLVNSSNYDSTSGSRRTIHVYRAMGASPSAGVITMNFAETETDVVWSVDQFSGVDTSGTNGSGAIVQSANNKDESGTVNTLTVTLAAFGSANNATFGAFGAASSVTFTEGSGFAILAQQVASLSVACATEFKNSNDTSVDITISANDFIGGVAIEIKASVAAGVATLGYKTLLGVGK